MQFDMYVIQHATKHMLICQKNKHIWIPSTFNQQNSF